MLGLLGTFKISVAFFYRQIVHANRLYMLITYTSLTPASSTFVYFCCCFFGVF